ncbi:hypothetical protein V8B97DRAFT_1919935 [Scleroderma yunnanense]
MIVNCTTTGLSASRVKLEPVDTSMLLPADPAVASLSTNDVDKGDHVTPVIDDSVTEPESQVAMPTVVKNTIPVYVPPTWVPCPTFGHSFMLDSFARLETFESISTQLITERWAQIQAGLIMGCRVISLAQKDIGLISQTFPFPICAPLPPLSPDIAFLDPPCFSPSPVKQEMLDHGTLTGEDINILTFDSVLLNLRLNFHSPEVLLSAVDYFQEYNTRTSIGGQPLTPFVAHHLPLDPEQHALKHQLQWIVEEVHAQESSALDEGPPPDQGDLCYADGFWYHSDANNIPHETELQDDSPQSRDKDDPDLFFIDEEVQSDNLDLADILLHITVIHAVVSWLHLQFHLPCIACNALLAVFMLFLLFLNPNITVPFTTLQSGNHLLGVNKPIHTLLVCLTCHDVYPPAMSLLCHDTYQTLHGNACAMKTLVIKYPYLPLSEQITLILKIPGMEVTLDGW